MKIINSKKNIILLVLVIAIIAIGSFFFSKSSSPKLTTPKKISDTVSVKIDTQNIKEENFSATVPTISGSNILATSAQAYIKKTVDDFRTEANTDVPAMRKEFGPDSPTAQYEIDIDAKYTKSEKTESVVMTVYAYTGGAHGNSSYKVITTSRDTGKILSLAGIVTPKQQNAFTDFVKKELNAWRPEGSDGSPVFPDSVKELKFNSFTNWSLDDKNLIIYFDQYEIGPGVLGIVAFPLSLPKIKDFLNPNSY